MKLWFVVNRLTGFLSFCYIYKDFVRQLKAFPPSFCHFCACEMSPGWGAFDHLNGPFERHFGPGRGEFEQQFSKKSNARGGARGVDVEASI